VTQSFWDRFQSSLESIVVCCSVDEDLMVDGALSCGQVFKIHPQRLSSLMVASGCGLPQERSAIPFRFAGYGADRSVMRGDHLRAVDVALSADLRQRPGLPCGLSP